MADTITIRTSTERDVVKIVERGPQGPTGPQGPSGEASGSIAWSNVTGKPSTFTPSAHTHLAADVTDLSLNKVPEARQTYNITSTNSAFPTEADALEVQNLNGSIDCVIVLNNTTGIVYADIVVPDLLNTPGSQRGRVVVETQVSGAGDFTNFRINVEGTIVYGYDEIQPTERLVFVWTGNSWNLETIHTATQPKRINLPSFAGTLALTSDITKTAVGLGNVTNNAQTQAAIVPNTAPSAGQLLVGNAGGTAYAPASVSGDATLSSAGVLTLANTTTARTNLGITQLPAKVEVFTSSGTWTKPAGAKMVHYVLVGGGGGGGGGRRSNSTTAAYGGGGGAGGGVSVGWLNADFLGATETVTIGAGGSGGSARTAADTNGADGVAGNTTSFTAYLEARGGAQGSGGTTTTGTRGAATAARGAFYGGTQDAMAGGGAGSPETTGGTGENRMSMPSGGGGGAGKSAAGAYGTGGASAAIGLSGTGSRTGISATANAAGTNGTGFFYYGLGGSGGSPNSTTGAANKGGDGGLYGAGGGGGAGSLNAAGGDNSGGAGANGVAVITTYF